MTQQVQWPGWDVIRVIGSGGFGTVYEIRRDLFGTVEKAALKVISIPREPSEIENMRSEGYGDDSIRSFYRDSLEEIFREYALMAKMKGNTNIVYCDDFRYIPHADGIGWDIYIKMELLTPLLQALPPQIPQSQALRVGMDICRALELCGSRNIIHRDIKPHNIFISEDGDYKLGDFGIAKTVEKVASGTRIGTFKYMAPEVYHGQPYGAQADIYSLGMVLYWMLNERRYPFLPAQAKVPTAAQSQEAESRRLRGDALPAPVHGSEALKQIVLKACAFRPQDRYATAGDMLAALNALSLTSERAVQPPVPAPAPPVIPPEDSDLTIPAFRGSQFQMPPQQQEAQRQTSQTSPAQNSDLREKIVTYLLQEFRKAEGIDLAGDNLALQRVRQAAANAAQALETRQEVLVELPYITATAQGPKHLNITVSKSRLLPAPSGGNGVDFGDLFQDLFGGSQKPARPMPQPDIHTDLELTLEEAALGCRKEVAYPVKQACIHCGGTGAADRKVHKCSDCGGQGFQSQITDFMGMKMHTKQPCSTCAGRGTLPLTACHPCQGAGQVKTIRRLLVTVPAGADDGQTLRIRGEGSVPQCSLTLEELNLSVRSYNSLKRSGICTAADLLNRLDSGKLDKKTVEEARHSLAAKGYSAAKSDLLLKLKVKPHDILTRKGQDIYSTVRISAERARTGTAIRFTSLDGVLSANIPAGIRTGYQLTVRGRGVPDLKNPKKRGDHHITVQVVRQ